jgi:mRNA-degrading endonuclease YafQ of YafQ-DinJ toxin-antitoxin module
MSDSESYPSLEFTDRFLKSLYAGRFGASEVSRILPALHLLDSDERHPSLRVHQLERELQGEWSASVTDELRVTFERPGGGRERLLTVSRHYQRRDGLDAAEQEADRR